MADFFESAAQDLDRVFPMAVPTNLCEFAAQQRDRVCPVAVSTSFLESAAQQLDRAFPMAVSTDLYESAAQQNEDPPGRRCVLGIANGYGSEGPPFHVLTTNVTVLTRARLHGVLEQAAAAGTAVITLREAKHPANGFRWVPKIASEAGWRAQWSAPLNFNCEGTQRSARGTDLFWKCWFAKTKSTGVYIAFLVLRPALAKI